jgi:hypothetical protein
MAVPRTAATPAPVTPDPAAVAAPVAPVAPVAAPVVTQDPQSVPVDLSSATTVPVVSVPEPEFEDVFLELMDNGGNLIRIPAHRHRRKA